MNVEKMQIFVSRDPKIHKHILILSDLVIIKMNEWESKKNNVGA